MILGWTFDPFLQLIVAYQGMLNNSYRPDSRIARSNTYSEGLEEFPYQEGRSFEMAFWTNWTEAG